MELTFEAVLFDMDGTLVDSTRVVEMLWAEFAAQFRLPLEPILQYAHGRQTADTITRFLPAGAARAEAIRAFEVRELEWAGGLAQVSGAGALLSALDRTMVAIVTSASPELAIFRMAAVGLELPTVVVTSGDSARGKPDPAPYLLAAERLGVDPARCVIFEDAEAGLSAAVASGGSVIVVGEHESATTAALPRIRDFEAVRIIAPGRLRICEG